jgi:hypothetical protein
MAFSFNRLIFVSRTERNCEHQNGEIPAPLGEDCPIFRIDAIAQVIKNSSQLMVFPSARGRVGKMGR